MNSIQQPFDRSFHTEILTLIKSGSMPEGVKAPVNGGAKPPDRVPQPLPSLHCCEAIGGVQCGCAAEHRWTHLTDKLVAPGRLQTHREIATPGTQTEIVPGYAMKRDPGSGSGTRQPAEIRSTSKSSSALPNRLRKKIENGTLRAPNSFFFCHEKRHQSERGALVSHLHFRKGGVKWCLVIARSLYH